MKNDDIVKAYINLGATLTAVRPRLTTKEWNAVCSAVKILHRAAEIQCDRDSSDEWPETDGECWDATQ